MEHHYKLTIFTPDGVRVNDKTLFTGLMDVLAKNIREANEGGSASFSYKIVLQNLTETP